ncbi:MULTISPECIES: chaplin [unclassified Streptomyces]|uniref:chaplin n=1 Tax=unclassified Streptomyces TaxID=2593676 RepID=UPI002E342D50|nr:MULTISPECIES: chaplin family protein [unclassified Streptomyces]
MRQSLKACMFVVAASGVLGASCGTAYADAGAGGSTTNSPGVLSGNSIQVTVDTPVNACGNSVDAGAALNPAMGNSCGNGAPGVRQPLSGRRSPGVQRAPRTAEAPGVHRTAPEPAERAEPARRPGTERAERPGPAPVEHASRPAGHPAREAHVDAVSRARESADTPLLASTGVDELAAVAAAGGGLLAGGVLLLRRNRPRRG